MLAVRQLLSRSKFAALQALAVLLKAQRLNSYVSLSYRAFPDFQYASKI